MSPTRLDKRSDQQQVHGISSNPTLQEKRWKYDVLDASRKRPSRREDESGWAVYYEKEKAPGTTGTRVKSSGHQKIFSAARDSQAQKPKEGEKKRQI